MKVQTRVDSLKSIRKLDYIPGVLCGQESGPANIQVEKKEFLKSLSANGQTAVFPCEFNGVTHKVYIRDLQREVLRRERFQHFSLQVVSGSDKIQAKLQVHLENKHVIEEQGLVINQVLHEIEVKYGVDDKLEDILIDVSMLEAGGSLLLSDIALPGYLDVLTSMDAQVVSILAPRQQQEEEDETVEKPVSETPEA